LPTPALLPNPYQVETTVREFGYAYRKNFPGTFPSSIIDSGIDLAGFLSFSITLEKPYPMM